VLELGSLARVPLRAELSLERRALGVRLASQTIEALDSGLRALVGMLGSPLRRSAAPASCSERSASLRARSASLTAAWRSSVSAGRARVR